MGTCICTCNVESALRNDRSGSGSGVRSAHVSSSSLLALFSKNDGDPGAAPEAGDPQSEESGPLSGSVESAETPRGIRSGVITAGGTDIR